MRTTTTAVIIVGLMAICFATAQAQPPAGAAAFIAQIDQTLRDANVPLTETQRAQLQSNAADRGAMMRILTGDQRTVIRNSMADGALPPAPPIVAAPGPGAGMRAGGPMTQPMGGAGMSPQGGGMTTQQGGAAAANGRGADMNAGNGEAPAAGQGGMRGGPGDAAAGQAQGARQGGMMGGGNVVDMFSQRLADGGQPLTDDQKEQLGALTAGPEMMTQMNSILTPAQLEIINQGRGQRQGTQGAAGAAGTGFQRGAAPVDTAPPRGE